MKRVLWASTIAIVLAGPAAAQTPVVDMTQAMNMIKDLQQGAQQLGQLEQQLTQLQQTYYAFTHVSDLGSLMNAMQQLGIENPLPINPSAVQGLMNGTGSAQGMIGSLQGLFTGTTNANHVYTAPGDGFLANQVNQNGGGIAGAQALALQLYQSVSQHLDLMPDLQAAIATADDPSKRETATNRLLAEQVYIQGQQVQAQTLGNYMQAQLASRQQQERESVNKSYDAEIASLKAKGLLN
jgi:hypothetical protein